MNHTTVGEIFKALPESAEQKVMEILDSAESDQDKVSWLRIVLNRYTKELEARGVAPDYFAYLLVYHVLANLNEQSFPA